MLLPVLRPLQCKHPDCTLPEGGTCARANEFDNPEAECDQLARSASVEMTEATFSAQRRPSKPPPSLTPDESAPWRGRHLDLQEAEALVKRSPARLISVLGPFNAGKTSLMASFFLQIANGLYGEFPYRFASSRTLYGFQDLVARANLWRGAPGEQVVPHTPKEESSSAGRFLHLGLRPANRDDDRHLDVLLSDVPGEWLQDWTRRVDDESKRRLGFIPRSDGFVVVADSSALMDSAGPKMAADVGRLISRIQSAAGPARKRGFAFVFSKFDQVASEIDVPEMQHCLDLKAWGRLGQRSKNIFGALSDAIKAGFEVAVFAVSAFPKPLEQGQPVGVLNPFVHVMAHADRRERFPRRAIVVSDGASYFQAMRRWENEP